MHPRRGDCGRHFERAARTRRITAVVCGWLMLLLTAPGFAEQAPSPPEPSSQPAIDPDLESAQSAMRTFLGAGKRGEWANAAKSLDFSQMPEDISPTRKEELAFRLKDVIDRMALVPVDDISPDPNADATYEFPPNLKPPPIVLARSDDGNWRFTPETVGRIDALYEQYRNRPRVAGLTWLAQLFARISPTLTMTSFLLPNYQWICLLLLILLGFIADKLVQSLLHRAAKAWFRFSKTDTEYQAERRLWKPIGLLAQALVWYGGTYMIGLPPTALNVLLVGLKFFAIVAAVWTSFRLVDLLASYLVRKTLKTDTKFDDLLVPLVSKSLKVFAVVVGVLMCAEAFHLPIAGLLGGIGIGGAALAFASKDAISNVFGSVTVLTDRPFEIGDWIITEGVEGSVESVGFRSTRVRTFYNSQITLPNSRLTTAVVDNMGRRRYRRIKTMLSVQYDTTPEQIDAFCEGIRELIRRHAYTRKDYYHVYFNEFSDSSLNILLYCFLECPDWSIELREKHRLFCQIVKLAGQLGVRFAFPSRTLHLYQEQHADSDLPDDLSAPDRAGRRLAAQIGGPLLPPEARPGGVEFTGPSDLGNDESA